MKAMKALWIEIVDFVSTIRHAFDYRRRADEAESKLAWIWFDAIQELKQQVPA